LDERERASFTSSVPEALYTATLSSTYGKTHNEPPSCWHVKARVLERRERTRRGCSSGIALDQQEATSRSDALVPHARCSLQLLDAPGPHHLEPGLAEELLVVVGH
jgi:hypothetical protein